MAPGDSKRSSRAQGARPFRHIQLGRDGDTVDGWRTTGVAESSTSKDLKLSFVVDWGAGNRVTFAGEATPPPQGDPNNHLGGTFVDLERRVELTFPGGEQVSGSFTDIRTR